MHQLLFLKIKQGHTDITVGSELKDASRKNRFTSQYPEPVNVTFFEKKNIFTDVITLSISK